ncbi:hypothetical protein PUW25_26175 (plasmid) [Paenibacillus urinalis]|uniref:Uncharacterized protein n=1 Tax=Paenibacillus urinalis TaxID=521520 RepID=A0ABY7XH26_9BACL|nr:hypothetical protein [Paenibacillus urinalis]WDI05059.1 hypothetical protein PUW25_26175 [Paenibacillus urinalis]
MELLSNYQQKVRDEIKDIYLRGHKGTGQIIGWNIPVPVDAREEMERISIRPATILQDPGSVTYIPEEIRNWQDLLEEEQRRSGGSDIVDYNREAERILEDRRLEDTMRRAQEREELAAKALADLEKAAKTREATKKKEDRLWRMAIVTGSLLILSSVINAFLNS